MVRVLLAVIALVALMWFFSTLGRLSGAERRSYLRRAGIYLAVGFVLAMVLTGRAPAILALVAGVIPWMRRAMLLREMSGMLGRFGIRIPGLDRFGDVGGLFRAGVKESMFLRMSRDHSSGRITGAIIAGRFEGQRLDDMALNDLLGLLQEVEAQDESGVPLLTAYLDQSFESWRDQYSGASRNLMAMSPSEALEVLGLDASADRNAVVTAHRKLMGRVHPDRGGVDWMATKLNQARDILLAQMGDDDRPEAGPESED